MRKRWANVRRMAVAAAVVAAGATGVIAGERSGGRTAPLPMAALPVAPQGDAKPPIGWVDFCKRFAADCAVDVNEPDRIALTPQNWKTLQATNSRTNAEIKPMTDMEHWGVVESWDYPDDGKGDCEDYALLKRKRLVQAGFPRRALLMTVVLDEDRAGHAVLMARTDKGDFILDNKRGAILAWNQTGYVYVKRESQAATAWISLGGAGSTTATAAR
jgi:predicted transglutaminase-like cysteine proteinase